MKKLIVVRHGRKDSDGNLTAQGREEVIRLGQTLKRLLEGNSLLLLSATSTRTMQTAWLLAEELRIGLLQEPILDTDKVPHDEEKASQLVEMHKDNADVIILVTTSIYCTYLPCYYGMKTGCERLRYLTPNEAEAVVLDCEMRDSFLLRAGDG